MASVTDFRQTLAPFINDLRAIFGERLQSLVVYGPAVGGATETLLDGEPRGPEGMPATRDARTIHTLAIVASLTFTDLTACATHHVAWIRHHLATPLIVPRDEFVRSLDAFPLEYGEILAHHVLLSGSDPFADVRVEAGDLRRACEVQAKSHLLHLRESYIETRARPADVARLIAASAAPFAALLGHIARLQGMGPRTAEELARHAADTIGLPADVVARVIAVKKPEDVSTASATDLFPAYLAAAERLAQYVDGWSGAAR